MNTRRNELSNLLPNHFSKAGNGEEEGQEVEEENG